MIYFEVINSFRDSNFSQTFVPAGVYCSDIGNRTPVPIGLYAERVWEETDDGVVYLKDRLSWDRKVDLKEFAWLKLQAKPLRDIL